jgi:hypothetical protein
MSDRTDGAALAGGLLASALMDTLVDKSIITIDEARLIVDKAMRGIGPDIQTPAGFAAADVLKALLVGKYSKRSASK